MLSNEDYCRKLDKANRMTLYDWGLSGFYRGISGLRFYRLRAYDTAGLTGPVGAPLGDRS